MAIAPFMPFSRGVSTTSAPEEGQHLAPLDRHRFRHGQDQPVAARGADEGESDAGIARGRLDQDRARPEPALGLHRLDHADPDAVLDAADRVEEFELEQQVGARAFLGARRGHADQRRVADGLGDAVVDASPTRLVQLRWSTTLRPAASMVLRWSGWPRAHPWLSGTSLSTNPPADQGNRSASVCGSPVGAYG